MDVLSNILYSLRVQGSVYFCSNVEPPWKKSYENRTSAAFHSIRSGTCWLEVNDKVEQLYAGDMVFVGPGIPHYLHSDHPYEAVPPNKEPTLLLCGDCDFDEETLSPLKDSLSEVTVVTDQEVTKHPWLKSTFEQISSEYMAQNPGSEILVNKLSEVILVELIRINFARQNKGSLVNALQDKRINKALQLLHDELHSPWTIDNLASQVGMSRAAFSKRFKDLVGETVFTYLSLIRVQKAKELIKTTSLHMDDIAANVGYESERAFIKTFSKYVGTTPKQYKKVNQ
ncbi:AraC family transcriptional regulator (plasmid) [Alteromonas macleodii]|jgi:AraC-like DNA-binding protein|uniref:HTH-type transcriptional regulator n=1 Tax=Pseudoalteromonas gelatinilytica TaxID=1703256 RepID=A0ABQ1UDI9_9GAMM|nr:MULTISPECIES: AraC family transcriptional regulator [Gammaproteobacteria]MDA0146682.1 AraC family transcriptional regulator [Vibrio sp. RW]GGF15430.1 putative HTH-type transcriptional regulator [Pseudoalteromonas profundi]